MKRTFVVRSAVDRTKARRLYSFVGLAAAAIAALFLNSALAEKTNTTKRPADFSAIAASQSAVFAPTGIVVKIVGASIAKDGTITARVTIVDSAGNPLDRTGVRTGGPVSMSLIAATIPAGQTQYVSYTTTLAKATINSNPSQVQAANDSGGTFAQNAIGDYTYTFKTPAPVGFDTAATHSIGISAFRDLSEFGTYDEWAQTSNDVFNFVPNGSPVTVTRAVVATTACNTCHNPLIGHGG